MLLAVLSPMKLDKNRRNSLAVEPLSFRKPHFNVFVDGSVLSKVVKATQQYYPGFFYVGKFRLKYYGVSLTRLLETAKELLPQF
jgi:hypothetical protein